MVYYFTKPNIEYINYKIFKKMTNYNNKCINLSKLDNPENIKSNIPNLSKKIKK